MKERRRLKDAVLAMPQMFQIIIFRLNNHKINKKKEKAYTTTEYSLSRNLWDFRSGEGRVKDTIFTPLAFPAGIAFWSPVPVSSPQPLPVVTSVLLASCKLVEKGSESEMFLILLQELKCLGSEEYSISLKGSLYIILLANRASSTCLSAKRSAQ